MWQRWQRLWRHCWLDETDLARALPAPALDRLGLQVAQAEQWHSGQVRVHAEADLPWSYLWRGASARERAITLFGKLGVWDTEANNGVLIYLLLAERAIEIVADRGLAGRVPEDQWRAIVLHMGPQFRAGRFEEGLALAVNEVSELLAMHFPRDAHRSGANELPDRPTLGEPAGP